MSHSENRQLNAYANLLCCLLVVAFGLAIANNVSAASKSSQTNKATTADQILKQGLFYVNNDDVTDKAVTQFRSVISKYPNSSEAESAQFYLGSYYQRKYYVLLANYGKQDKSALDLAVKEYRVYTDKYYNRGSHQWLADAFFNLALVYVQKGDSQNAGFELNKMNGASSRDGWVYIYQVVYSKKYDDIINGKATTQRLANFTSSFMSGPNKSVDQITAAIKDWFKNGTK